MKKYILIVAGLLLYVTSYSQSKITVDELLNKVKIFYEQKNSYSLNTSYTLYQDDNSNRILESYKGKIVKTDDVMYSKIQDTEFIQFSEALLKINHSEKAMLYANTNLSKGSNTPIDLSNFMNTGFKSSNIIVNNDNYIIELQAKEINFLPYSKIRIYIDKESYAIQKQELFLANKISVKDKNNQDVLVNPKLEIILFNFSEKDSQIFDSNKFVLSNYIIQSDNKVAVSLKYKDYNIIQN